MLTMPQTILTICVLSGIIILLISILAIYIIYNNKQKHKQTAIREAKRESAQPDSNFDADKYVIKERLAQFEAEERAKIEEALRCRRMEIADEIKDYEAKEREEQAKRLERQKLEAAAQDYLLNSKKEACETAIQMYEKRRVEVEEHYKKLWQIADERYQQRIDKYEEQINALQLIHSEKQTALEQSLADKEQLLLMQQAARLREASRNLQAQLEKETAEFVANTQNLRIAASQELNLIKQQIEDFKKKQQVINEEIMRRRQVEEQTDFYRIVLDDSSIDDIQILLGIRPNLKNRENLDKLIYDTYISKPVVEMTKRVLKGGAPSGIYKITRLKTGEMYVGKSTDIKKRWTEHAKTAYGVGTIAHSILHTTIKKDGIENFTFELLEEVPKDKLTEREKYWITFYDSKNYGLNERNG